MRRRAGFTLIELSIVMVIIGLVVGGIVFGRDLITAGQIRVTVGQLEKYNTAVNAFRNKYGGLPGDFAKGTDFGFIRNGDGDGCITSCGSAGSISSTVLGNFFAGTYHEVPLFWADLSQANMISGNFDGDMGVLAMDSVPRTFPSIHLIPKFGWAAYSGRPYYNGPTRIRNYYMMVISYTNTFSVPNGSGPAAWGPGVTGMHPASAKSIDDKIDDGLAGAGLVQAHDASTITGYFPDAVVTDGITAGAPALPPAAARYCAYVPAASTQWVYNVGDKAASCALRVQAPF